MAIETPLDAQVRAQLQQLRGDDFQYFVVQLLYALHGTSGFQGLRRTKDQGSDGIILKAACSIACYGPEDRRFATFKKKVSGDYASYKANWHATHPNWRVYINREPSPQETKHVISLHPHSQLHGVSSIMEEMRKLPWPQRATLYSLLRIDEALVGRDFLRPILDDLVSERVPVTVGEYDQLAPDFAMKIEVNFAAQEVAEAINLASLTFEQQAAAAAALAIYDDIDLNRIKGKVARDFANISSNLTFGERIASLRSSYSHKYNPSEDDGIDSYIHGLIMVLFAQCIIGIRPEGDGYGASSSRK